MSEWFICDALYSIRQDSAELFRNLDSIQINPICTVFLDLFRWITSLEEDFKLNPEACKASPTVCGIPPQITLSNLMEALDVVYLHHKSINGGKQGFMMVECDELNLKKMETQAMWRKIGWPSQGCARFEKTGQTTRLSFNTFSDTPVVLRTEITVERIDELGTVDTVSD